MSEVKSDLKYTKDHEWIKAEGDNIVVGITDFAQQQLTDVVFVELPEKGKNATAGKPMAAVESVKSVSDIFAPVSGEIVEKNEKLNDNPELINNDCYGEGWIAKIKVESPDELKQLMTAEEYDKLTKE
jgi:glycine cleavage system H protein